MKYSKKIKKHFEYISNKDYLQDCASDLSTLKCAVALLEGACCHFSTGESPLKRVNELVKTVNKVFTKQATIDGDEQINLYGNILTALCAYKKCTALNEADELIDACVTPLLNALFTRIDALIEENSLLPARSLSALNGIADFYAITRDKDALLLFNKVITNLNKLNFNNSQDNCYDYLCFISGALKLAQMSDNIAVYEPIARLFDNLCVKAQSLNYGVAISFINKKECSSAATAKSLEVALTFYALLQDERYKSLARRIWFNGLQFCQREKGQTGADTFTTEDAPNLKVSRYEVKQIVTPLYAIALKCYAANKELFEESGELFKDRRGRYFIGDKMFARDVSGFFGRDLIEIPTLTAFDSQTAIQLDFKLTF
ncbi:MAG: hypothetical protein E7339_04890 [Clostridiales bacterium]|nr:hypothetical protein [Clostridiales bacterium]